MSKYYEWQTHKYYEDGELSYIYYAIVVDFPKGKITQFEFELDDNNFYFETMTYNSEKNDMLKIEKVSPKIEKRLKHIIHVDGITKFKIFNFIFGDNA